MTGREKIYWLVWGIVIVAILYLSLPPAPRAASSSSVAIPFSLLAKTTRDQGSPPVYPADLIALDGRRVTISGFATPYDDPQTALKLLLAQGGGGCFFCAPPRVNGVVLVRRTPKASQFMWTNQPLTFEGILHLSHADSTDEDARYFPFTLDEAVVVGS